MPLTAKGQRALAAMVKQKGKKAGTSMFYALIHMGRLHGAEKGK